MNAIYIVLSVIALIVFLIIEKFKYKKFYHKQNLKSQYDKMEMYVIKKNVKLDRDKERVLKTFKNLAVNPDFLDIQILVVTKMQQDREKSKHLGSDMLAFKETVKSFGDEFESIFQSFDKSANKLVKISFLKPDFLWFVIKNTFSLLVKSRADKIKNAHKVFQSAQDNSEILAAQAMKFC